MVMHWRNAKPALPGDNSFFDGQHSEHEFSATIVGFEGGKWMPTIEETAQRVGALANVKFVSIGPDHLSIVAVDPAPFPTIAELTDGIRTVEVMVATKVPESDAERFREAHSHAARDMFDREGNPDTMNEGRAKLLAANIGIETPPVMNAIFGDKLGYLFATVEDAEAFDRANGR